MSLQHFPTKQPEIGRLVRALRGRLGLTQEKFAAKLGVTFPTVNRWENQHATPSPLASDKIEALMKQAGIRGQELLSGQDTDRTPEGDRV